MSHKNTSFYEELYGIEGKSVKNFMDEAVKKDFHVLALASLKSFRLKE